MVNDNQPNDCCDPYIDKIAKRKMVVMREVLDDQTDELKIKEINDDAFRQIKVAYLFIAY